MWHYLYTKSIKVFPMKFSYIVVLLTIDGSSRVKIKCMDIYLQAKISVMQKIYFTHKKAAKNFIYGEFHS